MPLTESERIARARLAGLAHAAQRPGRVMTAPARAAFERKFYDATPAGLPDHERARMAAAALRAHMARLSAKGVKARRAKASQRGIADGNPLGD